METFISFIFVGLVFILVIVSGLIMLSAFVVSMWGYFINIVSEKSTSYIAKYNKYFLFSFIVFSFSEAFLLNGLFMGTEPFSGAALPFLVFSFISIFLFIAMFFISIFREFFFKDKTQVLRRKNYALYSFISTVLFFTSLFLLSSS